MNQKLEITKLVVSSLYPHEQTPDLSKFVNEWWVSTRKKQTGGLRLTEAGFDALSSAGIKFFKIKFEEPMFFNNQVIIWLDQLIDCPFYITKTDVFVFNEKLAVQLVLFSGNIVKFVQAKSRSMSA